MKKISNYTKKKWWYKTIRSINWFSFRYWWLIWVIFLVAMSFFMFKCCNHEKPLHIENESELNKRFNSIDSLLYNCCECSSEQNEEINHLNDSLQSNPPGTIPCNARTESGQDGVTQNNHDLGGNAGIATIDYEMFTIPDKLEVYYEGNLVASTRSFVSNSGSLTFNYTPNHDTYCIVVVTGLMGTDWVYTISCPR